MISAALTHLLIAAAGIRKCFLLKTIWPTCRTREFNLLCVVLMDFH